MNLSVIFQSNEPPETITVSSFAQKFRPRNMAPYMTPPRYSSDPSSPKMNSDPLLAGSPVMKTKSIPSDGTVGGFPVKFLDMVVCPELPSDVESCGTFMQCAWSGGVPGFAQCQAVFSIHVEWMHLYFNGLPDETIHVSGLGVKKFSVLQYDGVILIETMFCHCRFVWLC